MGENEVEIGENELKHTKQISMILDEIRVKNEADATRAQASER